MCYDDVRDKMYDEKVRIGERKSGTEEVLCKTCLDLVVACPSRSTPVDRWRADRPEVVEMPSTLLRQSLLCSVCSTIWKSFLLRSVHQRTRGHTNQWVLWGMWLWILNSFSRQEATIANFNKAAHFSTHTPLVYFHQWDRERERESSNQYTHVCVNKFKKN